MIPIAYVSKSWAAVADTDLRTSMPGTVSGVVAARPAFALRVGGAGALHVAYECGVEDTILGLVAGELLYGRFARLIASGSTATNVTAFWGDV